MAWFLEGEVAIARLDALSADDSCPELDDNNRDVHT
jgi:hypothetical protein